MITIKQKIYFTRGTAGRRQMLERRASNRPTGSVPRISKLMALAIRFDS